VLTGGEMDDLGRHASDKLGQPMASQISPEAIGLGSSPGQSRPIPMVREREGGDDGLARQGRHRLGH